MDDDNIIVVKEDDTEPKIGNLLRGQGWVELHGIFYPAHLRALANQIEKNCKGLGKHDNTELHNG